MFLAANAEKLLILISWILLFLCGAEYEPKLNLNTTLGGPLNSPGGTAKNHHDEGFASAL